MVKVITSSVVLLLVASAAFGQLDNIHNNQTFSVIFGSIGAGGVVLPNQIEVTNSGGHADLNTGITTLSSPQNATANFPNTIGNQNITGTFGQTGVANTTAGAADMTVKESLTVGTPTSGALSYPQDQKVYGNGNVNQGQGVTTSANVQLANTQGGAADGKATTDLNVTLKQDATVAGLTTANETTHIIGSQVAKVNDASNATGSVGATMQVTVIGSQIVQP